MVVSKRKNRAWITLDLLETCRVSQTTWPIMSGGSTRRPVWKLVLSYELEVWKRAYNNLRNGKLDSLRKAVELARAEIINKIINRHFLVPLTASTEFLSTPAGLMVGLRQVTLSYRRLLSMAKVEEERANARAGARR